MIFNLDRSNFYGPWAGLPVAWDRHFHFDEETYRADVVRCCEAGASGIYTGGTTGEFYAMEFDEFRAVASATIAAAHAHRTPAMIGCTSTYTMGAARRAAFAAEQGADGIQVALPFWVEIEDAQLVPFLEEVSAAAGGLPLSIYDTRRSRKILTLDHHRRIKDAVPSYTMVKANAGTLGCTVEGCRTLSEFVNVFSGEREWARLGPAGLAGCCSSMIYWFPSYLNRRWSEVSAGSWPAVERASRNIQAFYDALFRATATCGLNDSGYDRLGSRILPFLGTSLWCRAPAGQASEADAAWLREWCRAHQPEMLEP